MATTATSSQRTPMTSSFESASLPVQAVLRTPELLEFILLHIHQRALITSVLRVNRWFNDVISTSPRLQAHLFFRPRRPAQWDSVEINQMVADLLPISFDPGSLLMKSRRFHWDPNAPKKPDILRCPCVARRNAVNGTAEMEDKQEAEEETCQWEPNTAWCRPGASWRRMLVLQPTRSLTGKRSSDRHCIYADPLPLNAFLVGHQRLVMEELLLQAQQKGDDDTHVVLLLQFCNEVGKATPFNIFLTKRMLHGGGNMTYLQAEFPRSKLDRAGRDALRANRLLPLGHLGPTHIF